ncbi:hypothetical protein J7K93_06110, partial [bacterium]|nr:hypothetical protein [bacterium]
MRRAIIFISFLILFALPVKAQDVSKNITLKAQWNNGQCNAVFRRTGNVFVSNGSNIDVYRNMQTTGYQKLSSYYIGEPVYDIWVRHDSELSTYYLIYAACGSKGIIILRYNEASKTFEKLSTLDTPGSASAVMQLGNAPHIYVADGNAGLTVVDLVNKNYPTHPAVLGSYNISDFAHELWVTNDTTVFVAADKAGVVAFKTSKSNMAYEPPQLLDSIQLSTAYSGTVPALSVKETGNILYVAAGIGGLMTIDASNPENLLYLGNLNDTVPYTVYDVWLSGNYAYLAIGRDGVYGPVDITSPSQPVDPPYSALLTGGDASRIVMANDTAFVAAKYGGHVLINFKPEFAPQVLS